MTDDTKITLGGREFTIVLTPQFAAKHRPVIFTLLQSTAPHSWEKWEKEIDMVMPIIVEAVQMTHPELSPEQIEDLIGVREVGPAIATIVRQMKWHLRFFSEEG